MSPKAKAAILVVLAVAIAAAVVVFLRPAPRAPGGGANSAPEPAGPVGVPAYAPQGEVTPGFPKQLILDSSAAVTQSYAIHYSSSTNQYTAQWNSSSSMTALCDAYKQYLSANGWTITNDITQYAVSRSLYAENASSDVAVSIVKASEGTQISVTYVTVPTPADESGVSIVNVERPSSAPPDIRKYFDLADVQTYDGQVRTLSDGSIQSVVSFHESLEQAHAMASYVLAQNNFTVQVDDAQSSAFTLSGVKDAERLQVVGFGLQNGSSTDVGVTGTITIVLIKAKP